MKLFGIQDQSALSPDIQAPSQALDRRTFFKRASAAAGATLAIGAGANLFTGTARAAVANLDTAVLNFALNLEYLEAEYYLHGLYGVGLEAVGAAVTGSGQLGSVRIRPNSRVPFKTEALFSYAQEVARDELNHVNFLRAALTDANVAARPEIDLQHSFNVLSQAAGLGPTFDPFASEENFIIGSFIFEDVGVTAYNGAAPLITDKGYLQAAASILAVEAYHAGFIRLLLYQGGQPAWHAAARISAVRASLGGGKDQGVVVFGTQRANLVPTDSNSLAFFRSTREVLNIVYGAINATSGLFFPNGLNGAITS